MAGGGEEVDAAEDGDHAGADEGVHEVEAALVLDPGELEFGDDDAIAPWFFRDVFAGEGTEFLGGGEASGGAEKDAESADDNEHQSQSVCGSFSARQH